LVPHEDVQDRQFPEYVEPLFCDGNFDGVFSGDVKGAFDDPDCCGCVT
jgi:hypothetical protein